MFDMEGPTTFIDTTADDYLADDEYECEFECGFETLFMRDYNNHIRTEHDLETADDRHVDYDFSLSVSIDNEEHERHSALGQNQWFTCGLCDDEGDA